MIGFVTLGHLFVSSHIIEKVAMSDKANYSWEIILLCKLLFAFEVKVFNKWLPTFWP